MQRDPVCGQSLSDDEVRQVDSGTSRYATKKEHQGKWYYFCGLLCRTKFVANPIAYAESKKKP